MTFSVLVNVYNFVELTTALLLTSPSVGRPDHANVTVRSIFALRFSHSRRRSAALQERGIEQKCLAHFATVELSRFASTSEYEGQSRVD